VKLKIHQKPASYSASVADGNARKKFLNLRNPRGGFAKEEEQQEVMVMIVM